MDVCVCAQMNCCGVAGPQDYLNSLWYNTTPHSDGGFVPTSCCRALLCSEDRQGLGRPRAGTQ